MVAIWLFMTATFTWGYTKTMQTNQALLKKIAIVGSIILALLVATLAIISLLTAPRVTTEKIYLQRIGINKPQAIGVYDNQLWFSNGRSIIAYDPINGEGKTVSPEGTMPVVSKLLMSPDGKKVLFQTLGNTLDDSFTPLLRQRGAPIGTDKPYWWVLDLAAKTYNPVAPKDGKPMNLVNASWKPDSSAFYGLAMTIDHLHSVLYSFNTMGEQQEQTSLSLPFIDILATDTNLLLRTDQGEVTQTDFTGGSSTFISANVAAIAFNPKHPEVFYGVDTTAKDDFNSFVFNISNKKITHKQLLAEQVPIWSADGDAGFSAFDATGNSDTSLAVQSVSALSPDLTRYIRANPDRDGPLSCVVAAINRTSFVGCDSLGRYYIVHTTDTGRDMQLKTFAAIQNEKININFFDTENYFLATVIGDDSPAIRSTVYELLSQKGIDTSIVSVRFIFRPDVQRQGG